MKHTTVLSQVDKQRVQAHLSCRFGACLEFFNRTEVTARKDNFRAEMMLILLLLMK